MAYIKPKLTDLEAIALLKAAQTVADSPIDRMRLNIPALTRAIDKLRQEIAKS